MARPIAAAPVLRGKDALACIKAIEHPRPYTPPVVAEKLNTRVKEYLAGRVKK